MQGAEPPSEPRRPLVSRRAFLAGAAGAAAVCCAGGAWALTAEDGPIPLRHGHRHSDVTLTTRERLAAQPDAIARVHTKQRMVALTFDDGPDPVYTPTVLRTLARFGAHATFFTIGVNALAHPDLVRAIIAGGHRIGNHTLTHQHLEVLSPVAVRRELMEGQQAIIEAGAPPPTLFRPPRGFTDRAIGLVADSEKFTTVFWSLTIEEYVHSHLLGYPLPRNERSIGAEVDQILQRVRPGMIVLGHDGGTVDLPREPHWDRSRTVAALPLLLQGLDDRGYQVVDVDTLRRHGSVRA